VCIDVAQRGGAGRPTQLTRLGCTRGDFDVVRSSVDHFLLLAVRRTRTIRIRNRSTDRISHYGTCRWRSGDGPVSGNATAWSQRSSRAVDACSQSAATRLRRRRPQIWVNGTRPAGARHTCDVTTGLALALSKKCREALYASA
jgi:hypothetical protein